MNVLLSSPPYECPTNLALPPMHDSVEELLNYIMRERKPVGQEQWILPSGYYLHFDDQFRQDLHFSDAMNHIHIAQMAQDVTNKQLEEDGAPYTIKVEKIETQWKSFEPHRQLAFSIDHTDYTGEESDDLLRI